VDFGMRLVDHAGRSGDCIRGFIKYSLPYPWEQR